MKGKIHTIEKFTKTLITIAEARIPQNNIPNKKKNKPWFNAECKKAILQRKAALKNSKKNLPQKIALNINKREQKLAKQ